MSPLPENGTTILHQVAQGGTLADRQAKPARRPSRQPDKPPAPGAPVAAPAKPLSRLEQLRQRTPSSDRSPSHGLRGVLLASALVSQGAFFEQVGHFGDPAVWSATTDRQDPKGNLLMESRAAMIKGGDSGERDLPGHASKSELLKRIHLPKRR
ncbi:MAG: hypothetical protein QM755_18255 [Luteolibacter sp.]